MNPNYLELQFERPSLDSEADMLTAIRDMASPHPTNPLALFFRGRTEIVYEVMDLKRRLLEAERELLILRAQNGDLLEVHRLAAALVEAIIEEE